MKRHGFYTPNLPRFFRPSPRQVSARDEQQQQLVAHRAHKRTYTCVHGLTNTWEQAVNPRSKHTLWPTTPRPIHPHPHIRPPATGHRHGHGHAASPPPPPPPPHPVSSFVLSPPPPPPSPLISSPLRIRHSAMASSASRTLLLLVVVVVVAAAVGGVLGGGGEERTFIVRVDADAKPSAFPTHAHWYEAAVMAAEGGGGGGEWREGGPLIHLPPPSTASPRGCRRLRRRRWRRLPGWRRWCGAGPAARHHPLAAVPWAAVVPAVGAPRGLGFWFRPRHRHHRHRHLPHPPQLPRPWAWSGAVQVARGVLVGAWVPAQLLQSQARRRAVLLRRV